MKVHLIKKQTIEDYCVVNAGSRLPLTAWLSIIRFVDWQTPEDILSTFRTADLLGNGSNRVVFNIGGNNFRMICKYAFGRHQVHLFVCWIGTHAEYTRLCAANKQYSVNHY
ncbi:MAG: type II toxin-antitoxin system HigB family toxin [Flavipsychrobacter sp.]|nr:type II toxin-antitoxin system HigB family toxin [Flavipsychrobacter sp.]